MHNAVNQQQSRTVPECSWNRIILTSHNCLPFRLENEDIFILFYFFLLLVFWIYFSILVFAVLTVLAFFLFVFFILYYINPSWHVADDKGIRPYNNHQYVHQNRTFKPPHPTSVTMVTLYSRRLINERYADKKLSF